ncbi:MAG: hypothetical protein ABJX35_01690 [Hyphomicrobiales bacterium]
MDDQQISDEPKKNSGPYPGLRFYDHSQAEYFAGRDRDGEECTRRLSEGRLMILHGRSGCGKSSFLRAAVKPMLEKSIPGSAFDEGDAGLEVVRSTRDPLDVFAAKLIEICEIAIEGTKIGGNSDQGSVWSLRKSLSEKEIDKFCSTFERSKADIGKSGRKCFRLFVALSEVLSVFPILVVDQAEEIFTLREKKARELAQDATQTDETIDKTLKAIDFQAGEFFDFLQRFANDGARSARLIISLRTEYKGQFDDCLSERGKLSSQALIDGFYLEDLNVPALTEAILRPTLTASEWREKLKLSDEGKELGLSPRQKFRFEFEPDVAEMLAKELTTSSDVAIGGVLPTMQVTCLRLYEQARQAKGSGNAAFKINDLQRRRVGKIGAQIQEFLAERLELVCSEYVTTWKMGQTEAVEQWHRILAYKLVEEQADGRAVSSTEPMDDLIRYAVAAFKSEDESLEKVTQVINRLCDDDIGLLMRQESDGTVALGHDSVALALNKWRVRYDVKDNMMMRMNMSGATRSALTQTDLYPEGCEPHEENVMLHKDLHWDRLYPHFAAQKGFADRLGLNLQQPSIDLDLSDLKCKESPKDWEKLTENLRNAADKRLEEGDYVMVAADHHSFPWSYKEATSIRQRNLASSTMAKWSDILVTDLFTGNGLIGRPFKRENDPSRVTGTTAETIGKQYEDVIREALLEVYEANGQIKCHDHLSHKFIVGAAELVLNRQKKEREYFTNHNTTNSVVLAEASELASSGDGLVDWLLNEEDGDRARFIVGTAAARALALQAGAELYFATSHLTLVTRFRIDSYVRGEGAVTAEATTAYGRKKQAQLNQQIQDVIKHTNWQINIPPAQWKQGRNRALILRLAAVGYYTAEYVRSNADEFVRYVRDQLTERFAEAQSEGETSMRGLRINRDAIRSAVRDCYSIMKFDECGTEFYDLDSTTAYWTNHREFGSKSVASEIYNEMSHLRQRTVTNYETLARIIEWMRSEDVYDPKDYEIRRVIELKRCAWNNYKIFNFYDSARQMAEAALLLQLKMESV